MRFPPAEPLDRSGAIRTSLRAFVCGILSLLPVIGLIPSICAFLYGFRVRSGYQEWNPALPYLRTGLILAALAFVGNSVLAAALGFAIAGSL